ncbi:hypothetical protein KEM54_003781, partial [Ascosphaera aggregata]
ANSLMPSMKFTQYSTSTFPRLAPMFQRIFSTPLDRGLAVRRLSKSRSSLQNCSMRTLRSTLTRLRRRFLLPVLLLGRRY